MNCMNVSQMDSVTLKKSQFDARFVLTWRHLHMIPSTSDQNLGQKGNESNALFSFYEKTLVIARFKQQPWPCMKRGHYSRLENVCNPTASRGPARFRRQHCCWRPAQRLAARRLAHRDLVISAHCLLGISPRRFSWSVRTRFRLRAD